MRSINKSKEFKYILIGVGILAAVFVLIIIGAKSEPADDSIAGTYVLVDASGTGSEMAKTKILGAEMVINDDNTGTLSILDQETPVKINTKDKKISWDGGDQYSSYIFEKNKLTIDNGGYKAVFKKK